MQSQWENARESTKTRGRVSVPQGETGKDITRDMGKQQKGFSYPITEWVKCQRKEMNEWCDNCYSPEQMKTLSAIIVKHLVLSRRENIWNVNAIVLRTEYEDTMQWKRTQGTRYEDTIIQIAAWAIREHGTGNEDTIVQWDCNVGYLRTQCKTWGHIGVIEDTMTQWRSGGQRPTLHST